MSRRLPDDVAVRVSNLHKDFHLPHHDENSLKRKVINTFQKKDKDVDTLHALRGITFDIKKGEFFGILGRNGSGKSTLLKIISEIYQPTSGHVQHRGRLVAFIELGVGFKPELSGRENIYLNAAMLGFSRKETDAMYDEIVSFAELEDFMEQKLKNYSSGMKVRLAFSVAIRADADILVLDEVLAVGDAAFQRKCYEYFTQLKDDEKTIIFVTHSMGQVKEYCDRAILIEDGKITFSGDSSDAADEYLRLFNRSQYEKERAAKLGVQGRWGSGEILIDDVSAKVTKNNLELVVRVKGIEHKLIDAIIGVDIYNDKRVLVTGVEGAKQRSNSVSITAGKTKAIRYRFDNYFGGGAYRVTISLKSKDGSYIYDYWKDACEFVNDGQDNDYFPSLYPLDITVD